MNKYVLMLVAASLIAAAPAYYTFQAQAEETIPASDTASPITESRTITTKREINDENASAKTPSKTEKETAAEK